MSDWLEQLKNKLLKNTKEEVLNVEEILQTEIDKSNQLFATSSFLNECIFSLLYTGVSTIEGMGDTFCYARAEITGIVDDVHIFIPQEYLKKFCEYKFGQTASEDSEMLRAFLKFFLLEILANLQSHPILINQIASLIECHIGITPNDLKEFEPAQSIDIACTIQSMRMPIRITFSKVFKDSWKAGWIKNISSYQQQRSLIESQPVKLCLHAAFAEISDQEIQSLKNGDWIVLEKVGFDSQRKSTTVMILAEGIRIGIGVFNGEELLIKEMAPSQLKDKLQSKMSVQGPEERKSPPRIRQK